jgi:hypothetical protein
MISQSPEDLRDLCRGLPLPKNYLGHSVPQGAMVIDLGESQIFEWQMPQPLHRFVRLQLSLANFLE